MENGKAAIARNLIDGIGFGTTEFHVFHPHSNILPEWIFYFIRRETFRERAKMSFRGAVGQQRVPEDFLVNQEIPIPYPDDPARSLAEQRRIVARLEAMLSEVRALRDLLQSMRRDWSALIESALAEVFPSHGQALPEGWEMVALGNTCDISIGKTPPTSRTEYWGGAHTWVTIADMDSRIVTRSQRTITDKAIQDNRARLVKKGTLLMSFKLTIGKLAFAGKDLYTNEAIAALEIKSEYTGVLSYDYLYWVLQAVPLETEASLAVKGKTINQKTMRNIHFPLPPLAEQRRIVAYLGAVQEEVNAARRQVEEDERRVMQLEQSILAAAFRGEV